MEYFDEEKILSLEELVERLHRHIDNLHGEVDKTLSEIIRRFEISYEFLEEFCAPHMENRVWFIMLNGGGAYLVSELLPFVDCSSSNLYKIIDRLRVRGLAKVVGNRWQAISPEAFIREKRTQKRKL